MNKKYILIAAGVLAVLAGGIFMMRVQAKVISSDTVISENLAIQSREKLLLVNGAKLTVKGNLVADGSVECEGGPLNIIVEGDLMVNKDLKCARSEDADPVSGGISIVVKGKVNFSKDAVVASNHHVQVVSDEKDLIKDAKKIEEIFNETGQDTGTGPRIGPFVSENATQKVSLAPYYTEGSNKTSWLVKTANAQVPRDKDGNAVDNVIIGGKWYVGDGGNPPSGLDIPTPPKGVNKIILYFSFGANGNVDLRDFYLVGPDGREGKSDEGKNCNARGDKGEDAFRMRVQAANININNFTLQLGNGGPGGNAETMKDCDPGTATGGKGGEAGNFKMTASGSITIASFHIIPGTGGNGGMAIAHGKDGVDACPGVKGGDATATGGDGGNNKKELSALGAVSGIVNVKVDEVIGGFGGMAEANPGKGGNGTGCNCNGGKGGDGKATGGRGGDASVKLVGAAGVANGGNGGDADSHGGTGGTGGHCPMKASGGNGGAGGNATSKEGQAGKGTSADGTPGNIKDETGGDGGNGGDGCGPGKGGKGGTGNPDGKDGDPGKLICPTPTPETPKETDRPATSTATPTPTETQTSTQPTGKKIGAIEYRGKYLSVDQLIIEAEEGCDGGKPHWHALEGVVKATDGSFVPDPGPQCGYGKQSEKPVLQITVQ